MRLILFLAIILQATSATAETRYRVEELWAGRQQPYPRKINDNGQVVWTLSNLNGNSVFAAGWTPETGERILFGPLSQLSVSGLSNSGSVVGHYQTTQGFVAYLWSAETGLLHLGSPIELARTVLAWDVNDNNTVVGTVLALDPRRVFRWTPTQGFEILRGLGNVSSQAHAINSRGEITGSSSVYPCYWSVTGSIGRISLLPGHVKGWGADINDHGVVAGTCVATYSHERSQAFLWNPLLGTQPIMPSSPGGYTGSAAINNSGVVVGNEETQNGLRAFIYTPSAGTRLLDSILDQSSAGWLLVRATALNNRGEIVGQGWNPAGRFVAFIARPVER